VDGVIKKVMFMKRIIFKRYPDGDYWPIKYVSLDIDILINFLATDVGPAPYRVEGWIEWLNHSEYPYTSSNATNLFKGENEIVELSDVLSDDNICFIIKKQKLIELLTTWEKLNQEKPNFIVITINGENIAMTGVEDAEIPSHKLKT
jgi:predicted MPP superfamily phosphohydrolase